MLDKAGARDFHRLFVDDVPLMDVRAPIEFSAGAFPNARNHPILDDEQRHQIGIKYAQNGQQSAIELGEYLATPQLRNQRLRAWQSFVNQHPEGYLYCFRGGLRSHITQQWLQESGIDFPLIEGGYKALRHYLLGELERLCNKGNIILLCGATGVGKTELILDHSSALDLEARANHRGSAFGKTFTAQPAQIDFENQIIIDWLKLEQKSDAPVVIEAESNLIGRICLPSALQTAMKRAPHVLLLSSMQDRVRRLSKEYVSDSLNQYHRSTADPWNVLENELQENLGRIKKRLGGVHHKYLSGLLPPAILLLRTEGDWSGFKPFIETLLTEFYDKLYSYHFEKNKQTISFQGEMQAMQDYLRCTAVELAKQPGRINE